MDSHGPVVFPGRVDSPGPVGSLGRGHGPMGVVFLGQADSPGPVGSLGRADSPGQGTLPGALTQIQTPTIQVQPVGSMSGKLLAY